MDRKYVYRRKLPHYQWTNKKTYFISFSTHNREVLSPHSRQLVLETCLRGNNSKYKLHAVVIMPDHVHLMLSPVEDKNGPIGIPEILQEIKSVSAHRINRYLGRKGRVWQEESFDRAMREVEDARAKVEYMLANPVRARLVQSPYDYAWLWTESTRNEALP
jgi:REP element-mobilizing transposase RayT